MIKYKHKKDQIISYKSHLLNIEKEYDSESIEFFFSKIKQNSQILIIGAQEYKTIEIIKLILAEIKKIVCNPNITIYTKYTKNTYEIQNTIISSTSINSSTIDNIMTQVNLSNSYINIFDRSFNELEYEMKYKPQFEKLTFCAHKNKICNITITNYLYESHNNGMFDYIFCTHDIYFPNVNRLRIAFFPNYDYIFFKQLFYEYASLNSIMIIEKNNTNYSISKYVHIKNENYKKFLLCENDLIFINNVYSIEI